MTLHSFIIPFRPPCQKIFYFVEFRGVLFSLLLFSYINFLHAILKAGLGLQFRPWFYQVTTNPLAKATIFFSFTFQCFWFLIIEQLPFVSFEDCRWSFNRILYRSCIYICRHIILEAKSSLLYSYGEPWGKKTSSNLFDVTMGSYDGAESCELVGAYLLHKKKEKFGSICDFGLYRDDDLGISRASPRQTELIKKDLCGILSSYGMQANRKLPWCHSQPVRWEVYGLHQTWKYPTLRKQEIEPSTSYYRKHSEIHQQTTVWNFNRWKFI